MPERNKVVPYPAAEMLKPPADLELILLNIAQGRLPKFSDLPPVLISSGTDAYGNWLHQLTILDQPKRERGGVPHVRTDRLELIYPNNPDVGTEEDCGWTVSRNREKFTPTAVVHSHASNFSFSGDHADIGTILEGWGKDDDYFLPRVSVVSTPDHNYALVATQETPFIDRWQAYYALSGLHDQNEFMQFRRFGNKVGQSIPTKDRSYWTLFEKAEKEHLRGDFWAFYVSFIDSFNAAELYNMGFYYSQKDGTYYRFTPENLLQHMTSLVDRAFERSA